MAEDKITPEEKLLKIIENPLNPKNKIIPRIKAKAFDLKALERWFQGLRLDKNTIRSINLQLVNKAILALCGFLTFFCIFDFFKAGFNLNRKLVEISKEAKRLSAAKKEEMALGELNLGEIVARARKHNIFAFLTAVATDQSDNVAVDITQVISNLKLVGIIWSNNPQVMIEDIKEQKTYLVNKGDAIGELTIKKILRDKAVLGKDDQEWELR